ncbi:TetR/AcrR family transcriptional regulator [Gilvimarinus sp. F26214L]|uniref:TetR/AcrR family transcriptional regulator n=1 Tax=Gilvimarinus sp. DZF01 TaxID=3461371 RepID=UPI0040464EF0
MKAASTRNQIVQAADQLFYQKGFEHTSFADIAAQVNISRGNFYYHFRTKDEILDAVIELRLANTQAMLDDWAAQGDSPEERIRCYIRIVIANQSNIMLYGCPVGTLCSELAKLGHPAQSDASRIFTLFRTWLREQFVELGRKKDADALAMHVLAWSQGVATLATAFHDRTFINQEVKGLCNWLETCKQQAT